MISKHFKNKKVIITGHTGFKGAWLTMVLYTLGAKIMGISLKPNTKPSLFEILGIKNKVKNNFTDITNKKLLEKQIVNFKPDYLFHLAAQPLINISYERPYLTWQSNLIGTINVIEAILKLKKKCVCVLVTSDKCYENNEKISGYIETDRLGGIDPYSASKAAAEISFNSYFNSYLKNSKHRIATARAGNVIGGGDWNYGRIIPDCISMAEANKKVKIRNINSSRPWQHVIEIVFGYLNLAICLKKNKKINGESFNFGPKKNKIIKVFEILKKIKKTWPKFEWDALKMSNLKNETNLLVLNCHKSEKYLKWKLRLNFSKTLNMTLEWYKFYFQNKKNRKKITSFTIKQIKEYLNKLD